MEELDLEDLEIILTSLEYGKMNVRESQISPYEVKQENLARIDKAMAKVRALATDRRKT